MNVAPGNASRPTGVNNTEIRLLDHVLYKAIVRHLRRNKPYMYDQRNAKMALMRRAQCDAPLGNVSGLSDI